MARAYVILMQEGHGGVRLEVTDAQPPSPCVPGSWDLGLSVRMDVTPGVGFSVMKQMSEERRGWSAFSFRRQADGGAVSDLPPSWSIALVLDTLDAATGKATGRLAVAFGDAERSAAAGRFTGSFCN